MVASVPGIRSEEKQENEIWRPLVLQFSAESIPSAEQPDVSVRTVRSLLNKLSPLNFGTIVEKCRALVFSETVRSDVSNNFAALLLEKAVTEPLFSWWYLEMLSSLSDFYAMDNTLLPSQCPVRLLFVKNLLLLSEELRAVKPDLSLSNEIKGCTDVIKKAELQEHLSENKFKLRRKFIGFGRVLGESFILGIITSDTVTNCINSLLLPDHEYALEGSCKLISIAGKFLESQSDIEEFDSYLDSIRQFSENPNLSIRLRYLLFNLIELRNDSWISKQISKKMIFVERIIDALSKTRQKPANASLIINPESEFQITTKEAQYVNKMMNKFTQCRRNLAEVLHHFNELETEERSRLIRAYITCVVKGDIYSEDCGKLFSLLAETQNIKTCDIINGIKAVIKGYCDNLIFADQQIWTRLLEVLKPLISDQVMDVEELIAGIDTESFKKVTIAEKKNRKKNINIENKSLLWQRGVPVDDRSKRGKKYVDAKQELDQEEKDNKD